MAKKVFITGGTGTVGMSLLKLFHRKKYELCFQYLSNDEKAMKLEKEFTAKSFKIDFLKKTYDLPDMDFDILINNLGINISDVLTHDVKEEDWLSTLTVNLTIPFKICKSYLPNMMKKGWGRIININSIYGLRGVDYNSPYNASKHGLSGLTKSIAKEYAQYNITCNEICPGAIQSELMNRIAKRVADNEGTTSENFLKEVSSLYPAKRMVTPNEVSSVAFFLASEAASYVNGSSIIVDGGLNC